MIKNDELMLLDFLGEKPDFFHEKMSPGLSKLMTIGEKRGGVHNPYGIPLQMLGGVANPHGIISYLSGIFSSLPGKKGTDFITQWVKAGIEQKLHSVLSTNGNALEWFILEMLIDTKIHETSFFERPPLELDAYHATDLLYSSPHGLKSKGNTLGIQITTSPMKEDRFKKKREQIRTVNTSLKKDERKLKIFGHKKPDTMGIIGIYGRIRDIAAKAGHKVFCHDLGLPLESKPIPFADVVFEESRDIADFIRISITTWDSLYPQRKKYKSRQKLKKIGRDGNYILQWRYNPRDKSTQFYLKKQQELVSFFEILDAE